MRMRRVLALASAGLMACAPTAEIDSEETAENIRGLLPPVVAFDPSGGVIPTPNTLGLVDTSTLRLDLPQGCGESPSEALIRTTILNTLNGWPATRPQPIDIPLTAPVDLDSVEGSVLLLNLATTEPVSYTAVATTVDVTDDACDVVGQAPILRLIVTDLLAPGEAYAVVVRDGLLAEDGSAFEGSTTWKLVRQAVNPIDIEIRTDGGGIAEGQDATGETVTFDVNRNETPFDPSVFEEASSILGVNTLWAYHNEPLLPGAPGFLPGIELGLAAAGNPVTRDEILHAFLFLTQDVTDVFDTTSAMSPAAQVAGAAPTTLAPFDPDGDPAGGTPTPTAPELIEGTLCSLREQAAPCGICDFDPADNGAADDAQLPCWAAGQANVFEMSAPSFLTDNGTPVPGGWSDPYVPMKIDDVAINGVYFEPNGAALGGTPSDGWPVVLFGHGLTRSRLDVFPIVAQLNAAGIAVAAIDFPLSGDPDTGGRAIQISTDGACAGAPDVSLNSECFAPLIGPDLAGSRDYLRQGLIEHLQMIEMLKFCADNDDCEVSNPAFTVSIDIDPAKIGFIGQSLGGILGGSLTAVSDDVKASVLNVAGSEWVSILENSEEPRIICPLVQLLATPALDGGLGVISIPLEDIDCDPEGTSPPDPSTWNTDPGYIGFTLIAQWILDAADSVQLAQGLAGSDKAVLVQEVDGDGVIPNASTERLASVLLGLTESTPATTNPMMPTAGIVDMSGTGPGESLLYVEYSDVAGSLGYCHGSLLTPADTDCDPLRPPNDPKPGANATTAIMQTDAITFLNLNLNAE